MKEAEIDGIRYRLDDGTATVIKHDYSGSVVIPPSVTYEGCEYKVERIDEGAFEDCKSLENIIIPASVTKIGKMAFDGNRLKRIIVEEGNPCFDSRENCNGIIETATRTLVVGCKNTIIPDGIECIGFSCFYGNDELEHISIPTSVKRIGESAFHFCTALKSIVIPEGVEIIDTIAFHGCDSLESIVLPDSVTYIGENAFSSCWNIKSVTLPANLELGEDAFYSHPAITRLK